MSSPTLRAVESGPPTEPEAPPPPASFRRCREACGRLVWNYETGLCAQCDPWTQRVAQLARQRVIERQWAS